MAGMSDLFDKAVDKHMGGGPPDMSEKKEGGEPSLSELREVATPEEAQLLDDLVARCSEGAEAPDKAEPPEAP